MFYWIWLKRVLFSTKHIFQMSSLLSLMGLVLGVASLTVAVLIINGFSLGIERAIVNMSGHVIVSWEDSKNKDQVLSDIAGSDFIKSHAFFLSFEGVLFHKKNFKSVWVEGVDDEQFYLPSFFQNRFLKKRFTGDKDFLVAGRSLAQEMGASLDSPISLVVFGQDSSYFSRVQKSFRLGAIGDFGRHDFNSRYVLLPLSLAQSLYSGSVQLSGVRLWLKDGTKSEFLTQRLRSQLPESYQVHSWRDMDKNFLKIIEMDKKIIFFVLFILIIAASFNIASSLYVEIFKRTKEISLLKSMGGKKRFIQNLFLLNGLVLGSLGSALGILLGWGLGMLLIELQNRWVFIPEDMYQVNKMVLEWKSWDFAIIFFASLTVVLLSSFFPARKAYQLNIKEGLAYD